MTTDTADKLQLVHTLRLDQAVQQRKELDNCRARIRELQELEQSLFDDIMDKLAALHEAAVAAGIPPAESLATYRKATGR